MADVITLAEVQEWLESTKLTLGAYDPDLYATAKSETFGRVSSSYDASAWLDTNTTPQLVQRIIAAKVAARTYRKAYSEVSGDAKYADWLEAWADNELMLLASGQTVLTDAPTQMFPGPLFYPNDISTADDTANEDIKFTMGQIF